MNGPAAAVTLDASPLNILRFMRGLIVDARIAYPEVLRVTITDPAGELWQLATQDAEWSPSDPAKLVGCSVIDADIDEETGELRCKLSDDSLLDVKPGEREAEDDPPLLGADHAGRRRLGVRSWRSLANRQCRRPGVFSPLTVAQRVARLRGTA